MPNFAYTGKALSGAMAPIGEKLFAPFAAVSADPVILRSELPGRTELSSRSLASIYAADNFVQHPIGSTDQTLFPRLLSKFKLGRYP
jgi:hypothetical protein